MSGSNQVYKKRYGVFALAVVVILAGIAAMFIWRNDFVLNFVGLLLMVVGVYLVKVSDVRGLRDVVTRGKKHGDSIITNSPYPAATNRPSPTMWVVGVILLVATGISYYLLHEDALNGGHEAWPVYLFGAVGVACVVFWSYLLTKLTWSK